jgi:AMMECR1 domain-containing protein
LSRGPVRAVVEAPCKPLARPLTRAQRERVAAQVRALLSWQRSLARWPAPGTSLDATPFVSLYARGTLRGCFGSHEGRPGERVARAFLRALEDSRYGMVRADERDALTAVVSYVRELRVVDADRAVDEIEPGTDGLAVMKAGMAPVVLLPHVARDARAGAGELLAILARKSGLADWKGATLLALRTEDVVVRPGADAVRDGDPPRSLASRWLASLVGRDGAVTFAIEARRRTRVAHGRMHHGRAAVVAHALANHDARAARRAKAWLAREIEAGLRGQPVEGWPTEPAMVAGTLALAIRAGLDVRRELAALASGEALRRSPWHAAQVVAAIGRSAPPELWRACTEDLRARPWAPWTLLAARALGDTAVVERAAGALRASIRPAPPHEGGCDTAEVPEIAPTALVVEALDGLPDAGAAVRRGRRFLLASQLAPVPAPLDPSLATGAFPLTPVLVDVLRCDVTAHALLALG